MCHIKTMSVSMTVFNRQTVRRHRDRAAAAFGNHDFLFRESAERLCDRLDDVKRGFPLALDLGCHTGQLARALKGRGSIGTLVQCDLAPGMAAKTVALTDTGALALACDEEWLPFGEGSFDLVMSNLSLHWVNDLPGVLVQVCRALKPDGLFLGSMLGGETLNELRRALVEAEIAEEEGLSPRISPMADVRDAGGLLQRAGFALPVADSDTITVMFSDPMKLMADLRGMGETNALIESRKGFTRPQTLLAAARYAELFADEDGNVPATFQIITLTGWAPDPSQQQPLKPGSASARLANALDTEEISAGEKAKPGLGG